jgi:hypothetical protein
MGQGQKYGGGDGVLCGDEPAFPKPVPLRDTGIGGGSAWSPKFVILKVVQKLSRVPFTLFREPPYGIRVISRIPRGEIRGLLGTTRVFSFAVSAKKKRGSVFVLLRDGRPKSKGK